MHIQGTPQADRKEMAVLKEDSSGRKARWQAEKEAIGKIASSRADRQLKRKNKSRARRQAGQVAEIRYARFSGGARFESKRKNAYPRCKKTRPDAQGRSR